MWCNNPPLSPRPLSRLLSPAWDTLTPCPPPTPTLPTRHCQPPHSTQASLCRSRVICKLCKYRNYVSTFPVCSPAVSTAQRKYRVTARAGPDGGNEGRTDPDKPHRRCWECTEPTPRVPDKSKASPAVTSGFASFNTIHSQLQSVRHKDMRRWNGGRWGNGSVTLECHFHGMSVSEDNML